LKWKNRRDLNNRREIGNKSTILEFDNADFEREDLCSSTFGTFYVDLLLSSWTPVCLLRFTRNGNFPVLECCLLLCPFLD